jgi:hypothetical protein
MFLAHSRVSYKYPEPTEKQPLFTSALVSYATATIAPFLLLLCLVLLLCISSFLCASRNCFVPRSSRFVSSLSSSSLATLRESFSIPCLLLPLLDAASVQFFVFHAIYLLFPTLSLYPSPPQSALPLRLRLSLCLHNPIVSLRFIPYRPTHSFALFLTVSPFLLTPQVTINQSRWNNLCSYALRPSS